ncbi:MAG: flagellar motor switch protein FliN [Bythopirellula sp.]
MADDAEQLGQDEIDSQLNPAQDDAGESSPSPEADSAGGGAQVDPAEADALTGAGAVPQPAADQTTAAPSAAPSSAAGGSTVSQSDIELLLNKAEQALESIDQADSPGILPPGIRSFDFQKFGGSTANADAATLELIGDVQLDMTIELGRTHMQLEELLKLKRGAVVALDKLAGDPADIYVNGRLVARGEVLVLNDNFCIRVAELIEGENAVA